MTEFETMILVFLVLVTVAGYVYYKLHQAEKRIDALLKQEKERLIEEQRLARIKHRESRLAEFRANTPPKASSGFVQSNRPTSKTVTSSYVSSPTYSAPAPVVVSNSSNDLLTAMIIQDALTSSHYKEPTTHYTNTSNPVDFPAVTPESSYSSSSSSAGDDSSSRSSYSSSYSSSSSDSSYSSSSSDSSYSSSSSDSSSNSD
jgi:cell division protein FtsN